MPEDVVISQIVTAVTTVFYATVFAVGYYLLIKGNRATLKEMREQRISGGRPQVMVEARYSRLPTVDLVVRNVSGGVAKDITFGFSAPIEDSTGFVLSELSYFERGMNFLGPGDEVACVWDDLDELVSSLKGKGLHEGILVTVSYEDLARESYRTEWRINPLIYEGNRHVPPTSARPSRICWRSLGGLRRARASNRPGGGPARVPLTEASVGASPLLRGRVVRGCLEEGTRALGQEPPGSA